MTSKNLEARASYCLIQTLSQKHSLFLSFSATTCYCDFHRKECTHSQISRFVLKSKIERLVVSNTFSIAYDMDGR